MVYSMLNNRLALLNKSKFLAMEEKYQQALRAVEQLLLNTPDDLDGLRLKGNILELYVYAGNLDDSEDMGQLAIARKCYEHILELNPNNTLALIDLGDYWQNQADFEKSLGYYDNAINLLKEHCFYLSLENEFVEAFQGKQDVLQKMNNELELHLCQKEEQTILSRLQKIGI